MKEVRIFKFRTATVFGPKFVAEITGSILDFFETRAQNVDVKFQDQIATGSIRFLSGWDTTALRYLLETVDDVVGMALKLMFLRQLARRIKCLLPNIAERYVAFRLPRGIRGSVRIPNVMLVGKADYL